MDFQLNELNYLAVLVGGIIYMGFGAIYFSPILFGNKWVELNKVEFNEGTNNTLSYVGSALVAMLSSLLMAVVVHLTGADGVLSGLTVGLLIGLFVSLAYLKNTLFGLTNKKVFFIAIGDHLIIFTVLGILHGLWQ
ncbi:MULTISPECIES: DUF1761 domain-containing protein [unclassified Bacillus (in: firmicutes)]|uniref:DUF1761 domain-containing protein n=1 Tax=unclassified Bacillus (in: firmicutes) TaxID=185979 RepID=UPI0008E0D38E|nr:MULTISPECIES: DUF1761 domain-containing protein [unclassified Bacillus (in: firmicutes)]SFB02881.1 Protein of unknown function [Bacillus sp. UNCCL13]SFQ88960.1 Protein of unknown function [Bacillus sp. cl95]